MLEKNNHFVRALDTRADDSSLVTSATIRNHFMPLCDHKCILVFPSSLVKTLLRYSTNSRITITVIDMLLLVKTSLKY